MIKAGIKKNFFNLIKGIMMKENVFPMRPGSILLLKVLASIIEQEKELKHIHIEKEEVKHLIPS